MTQGDQLLKRHITVTLKSGKLMSHSVFLLDPTPVDVTNFLAYLFMKGASHNAINTAGSALSAFLSPHQNGLSIGSRPEVCRILKGVFERRPALPM